MLFAKNIREIAKKRTNPGVIYGEKDKADFACPKTDVEKEKRIDVFFPVMYHDYIPKGYIQLCILMSE